MTDRIEEIRARWAAATPGPWEITTRTEIWGDLEDCPIGGFPNDPIIAKDHYLIAETLNPGDEQAIAKAPEDVAFLLFEVQRLSGLLAKNSTVLKASKPTPDTQVQP